jgi:hypothetical protein
MKPLLWGGQGPYKDCRATDNDNDDSIVFHLDIIDCVI